MVVAAVLVVVAVVVVALVAAVVSLLGSGNCSCNWDRNPLHLADVLEMTGSSLPSEQSYAFSFYRQLHNRMVLALPHQIHEASLPFHLSQATKTLIH